MSRFPVIPYAQAKKWEPLAAKRGVSRVARSSRGFMRAYQRAGSWAALPDSWKRKRNAFVSRHMAQARQNREPLWKGNEPTRRGLALLMWAYMPPRRNPEIIETPTGFFPAAAEHRAAKRQMLEHIKSIMWWRHGVSLTMKEAEDLFERHRQELEDLAVSTRRASFRVVDNPPLSKDAQRMLSLHRSLGNALWWAEAHAMEARLEGRAKQAEKWSLVYKELKAMKPKKTRKNPIPVEVAETLPYETSLPQSREFLEAVASTKGASLTEKGLKISVGRCQKPEQHDTPSIRGAVFYLPEGDPRLRYYKKKGSWYGGADCLTGTTLLKRPLVVRGATGGKVPEAALKVLTGDKKAPEKLDAQLNELVQIGWKQSRRDLAPLVENALTVLGGSPHLAEDIVEHSVEGNTLKYAMRENIICTRARAAGFDSIVGWSHGSKAGYFISEVIDLREQFYPAPWGSYAIHRQFKQRQNPAGDPPDPVYHGAVDRPERVPARAGDGDAVVVWREEYNRWECWVYDGPSRVWAYVDQGGKADMVRVAKEVVR